MKITYVIHRYGVEIHGGAELACRMFAERLAAQSGWSVEVLSTCAFDAVTWADYYEPGDSVVNGVKLRRFRSQSGRHVDFGDFSARVLASPASTSIDEAQRWVEMQGPVCPDLLDAAAASDSDLVVFTPYLYHPTVYGLPRLGERAVMHPAAHDEAAIHLPVFSEPFSATQGFWFYTQEERRLVERIFPVAERPQVVGGLGVDTGEGDATAFREQAGLGDRPYLVCLGRVDDTKGTGALARMFLAYKQRNPGPLALVFVGPVIHHPVVDPDIVLTGPVDENAKWGALRGSLALVSPSAFESFSLVVMEAWGVGVPVVVNGLCATTREHCQDSGGGLWFDGYASFEVVLDRLVGEDKLRAQLAAAGSRYVEMKYRWSAVIERYCRFLEGVAERC